MLTGVPQIFVGLGSNVGDRFAFLQRAVGELARLERTKVGACSSVYETEPVGVKNQREFLNMVVQLETSLAPRELVLLLKSIELSLGRQATAKWGPREIDLDLLYYGDAVITEETLRIPHAELSHRRFVLVPLKEIAENFLDPLRKLTVGELLRVCSDTSSVRKTSRSFLPLSSAEGI